MADAIFTLRYLFIPGSESPTCIKSADSDDDGTVSMGDAIYTLRHLFVPASPPPPAPFPDCGTDPTPDELSCESHPCSGGALLLADDAKESGGRIWLGEQQPCEYGARVPVWLSTTHSLSGFAYTVAYDPSEIIAASVEGEGLITEGFDFFSAKPTRGKLTVGNVISLTLKESILPGEHHVADLVLSFGDGGEDRTELRLVDVELVDTEARGLSCQTRGITVDRWLHLRTPKVFALKQAFPNPFTGATSIHYALPKQSHVSLKIYNAAGQLVNTLVSEPKDPGYYRLEWGGKDATGTKVASGVYFYRIETEEYTATKKMAVVR
jgi:hypothetical protein